MGGQAFLYVPIEVESLHVTDKEVRQALQRLRNRVDTALHTKSMVTLVIADNDSRRTFLYDDTRGVRERKTRFEHAL